MKKHHERTHMYGKGAGMLHCFVKVCVCVSAVSPAIKEVYRLDRISHSGFDWFGRPPRQPFGKVYVLLSSYSLSSEAAQLAASSQLRAPLHISFLWVHESQDIGVQIALNVMSFPESLR